MKDEVIEIFEGRASIVDNLDMLYKYGTKYQKAKDSPQMSLFDSEDIEVERVSLSRRKLSEGELIGISEKETEVLGVGLLYSPYDEYMLLEKTLCNSTLEDIINSTDESGEKIIMCTITKFEEKISKAGNKYYKIYVGRSGKTADFYLFSNDIKSNLSLIRPMQIHMIKILGMGNGSFSVKKIQSCAEIDQQKYIERVVIELPQNEDLIFKIRNYIYFRMKNKSATKYNTTFMYSGEPINNMSIELSINNDDCYELQELGCKIIIKKII